MPGIRKPLIHENLNMNKLILNFLIKTNSPLSLVDNESFKKMIYYANSNLKVWCRQTVSKNLDKIYNIAKIQLIKKFNNVKNKFALTSDIWTSHNGSAYCSLTLHYINDDWNIINIALDLLSFPHPHTGDDISSLLITSMNDFEFKNNIISITHDNGANVVKAVEIIKKYYHLNYETVLYSHRCMAHILNLIVNEGFIFLDDKLENIMAIVSRLHVSPKLLQTYQSFNGATKIPLPVKTRWNSVYLMIAAINKNIKAIQHLSELGLIETDLAPENIEFFSNLEEFLKPFYQITVEISSQLPTIGMAILFFNDILENLKNQEIGNSDASIREAATSMIKKYDEYSQHILTPNNYAASILDPRIKNTLITNLKEDAAITNMAIFKGIYSKYTTEPFDEYSFNNNNNPSNLKTISLLQGLKRRKVSSNGDSDNQINTYLLEPVAPETTNVLDWWRGNENRFPHLAKMARDFLCQQTTSVASERTFSLAGNTITKLRNRMAPSTLKQCISLSSWDINIMGLHDDIWQ
ncbi:unnamed protein product [Gordionus sp. m RMFG-2023]